MKTVNESISYVVEYRGTNRTAKTWGFTDLASAKEMYAEKAEEGKKPKLYLIRKITTKEQVYVDADDWKSTRANCS